MVDECWIQVPPWRWKLDRHGDLSNTAREFTGSLRLSRSFKPGIADRDPILRNWAHISMSWCGDDVDEGPQPNDKASKAGWH